MEHYKRITNLTQANQDALVAAGYGDFDVLITMEAEDIKEALPNATAGARKLMLNVNKFVFDHGRELTSETTLKDVNDQLRGNGTPASAEKDKQSQVKSTLKITVNPLESFSGKPQDWETWERQARFTICQSDYKFLVERPPKEGDEAEKTKNTEFFFMLSRALADGSGEHHSSKLQNEADGYKCWKNMQDWYASADTSGPLVYGWKEAIKNARLDEETEAHVYINHFYHYSNKLRNVNDPIADKDLKEQFIRGIEHEDYGWTKADLMKNQSELSFDACVDAVR